MTNFLTVGIWTVGFSNTGLLNRNCLSTTDVYPRY